MRHALALAALLVAMPAMAQDTSIVSSVETLAGTGNAGAWAALDADARNGSAAAAMALGRLTTADDPVRAASWFAYAHGLGAREEALAALRALPSSAIDAAGASALVAESLPSPGSLGIADPARGTVSALVQGDAAQAGLMTPQELAARVQANRTPGLTTPLELQVRSAANAPPAASSGQVGAAYEEPSATAKAMRGVSSMKGGANPRPEALIRAVPVLNADGTRIDPAITPASAEANAAVMALRQGEARLIGGVAIPLAADTPYDDRLDLLATCHRVAGSALAGSAFLGAFSGFVLGGSDGTEAAAVRMQVEERMAQIGAASGVGGDDLHRLRIVQSAAMDKRELQRPDVAQCRSVLDLI